MFDPEVSTNLRPENILYFEGEHSELAVNPSQCRFRPEDGALALPRQRRVGVGP